MQERHNNFRQAQEASLQGCKREIIASCRLRKLVLRGGARERWHQAGKEASLKRRKREIASGRLRVLVLRGGVRER